MFRQMAVIEYSEILGYADANSTEMNEHTEHPVVSLMEEQKEHQIKGQCVLELGNVISRFISLQNLRAIDNF
jgi:CTP synthase (UTP-ammonia lyase)